MFVLVFGPFYGALSLTSLCLLFHCMSLSFKLFLRCVSAGVSHSVRAVCVRAVGVAVVHRCTLHCCALLCTTVHNSAVYNNQPNERPAHHSRTRQITPPHTCIILIITYM